MQARGGSEHHGTTLSQGLLGRGQESLRRASSSLAAPHRCTEARTVLILLVTQRVVPGGSYNSYKARGEECACARWRCSAWHWRRAFILSRAQFTGDMRFGTEGASPHRMRRRSRIGAHGVCVCHCACHDVSASASAFVQLTRSMCRAMHAPTPHMTAGQRPCMCPCRQMATQLL